MIPISYNIRSLTVRKTTTVATALGIALVSFVFSAALMLSNGIKKTLGRSGRADNVVVMRKGSDAELASGIEEPLVNQIKQRDEIAQGKDGNKLAVGEVVVVVTLDKLGTTGISNVQVRGVPANVMEFRPEAKIIEGRPAQPGTDEVIVGKQIRGRFAGVDLNKTFELRKNRPVKVVGVFEAGGSSFESEVWGDVDTVRAAYGREGIVSSMRLRLKSPGLLDAFKASIEEDKQLGLEVERENVYYEKLSEGTSAFISVLGIMIAIFFSFGAMIGASITMYAAVAQRNKEIGTLRALGFSRFAILFSFVLESLMLALAGGAFGALISLAMQFVHFSTVNFASWSEIVFSFEPEAGILIGSMIFAGIMGLVGGIFPAIRAARMSPVEAMRA